MFFYSLFTTYFQLYTNRNRKYLQVPESKMSVRQGRDTVWKDVTFCIKGRQTKFINFTVLIT